MLGNSEQNLSVPQSFVALSDSEPATAKSLNPSPLMSEPPAISASPEVVAVLAAQ
jgi:hypothetical protein